MKNNFKYTENKADRQKKEHCKLNTPEKKRLLATTFSTSNTPICNNKELTKKLSSNMSLLSLINRDDSSAKIARTKQISQKALKNVINNDYKTCKYTCVNRPGHTSIAQERDICFSDTDIKLLIIPMSTKANRIFPNAQYPKFDKNFTWDERSTHSKLNQLTFQVTQSLDDLSLKKLRHSATNETKESISKTFDQAISSPLFSQTYDHKICVTSIETVPSQVSCNTDTRSVYTTQDRTGSIECIEELNTIIVEQSILPLQSEEQNPARKPDYLKTSPRDELSCYTETQAIGFLPYDSEASETFAELGLIFSRYMKLQARPCRRKYCLLSRLLKRKGKHDMNQCRLKHRSCRMYPHDQRPACTSGNVCKDAYDELKLMYASARERECLYRRMCERRKRFLKQSYASPFQIKGVL